MAEPSTAKSTEAHTSPTREPAHDVFRHIQEPLDAFFHPQTVALIGATETEGSVGRTILRNLLATPFGGTVYPVNPKRRSVLGIKAYPSVAEIQDKVDLAVIVTPAATVPAIVGECASAGVRAAVIISAGFKEVGEKGVQLEKEVLEKAQRSGMRLIGPNCLGVMIPPVGLNATFANAMARPGKVGFISQSGALCTAILDWSLREQVGFSAFISIGSMLDVGWGDLIDYLGSDPLTRSIIIYMESVGNAREFLSAAREVALSKPIIVIKAGRTEAAAKAAASHTGALTGSDQVLDAAFRRSGVLRVDTIAELFYLAEILDKQPRPKGPRLTVLTNAGGPGVLAADALMAEGGELAQLSPATIESFNKILPPHWSHNNPVDILGDADPGRYAKSVEIAAQDPNTDGLLVVMTPQGMTDPSQTAEQLRSHAKLDSKPILASWMGGEQVARGQAILTSSDIPNFPYPDTAARMFSYMWRYSNNLRFLYETPSLPLDQSRREHATVIIQRARAKGRTLLTEIESKQILDAYGVPTIVTRMAASEEEAARAAREVGYPAVLKLYSETITHKTDVGGVKLNLCDESAVRQAYRQIEAAVREKAGAEHFQGVSVQPMVKLEGYELILGSSLDAQFGPVVLFGSGGQLVEVYKDRALALPPLNTTLARRLMEQTKVFTALRGVRARPPVDLVALEYLLVHFSQLVVEQRWIKEIDINPLLASPERLVALDARVVLHGPEVAEEKLPIPAIRPYPNQYCGITTLRDGTTVAIRPIRPEDEPMMVKFHGRVSEQSAYMRYLHVLKLSQRIEHDRLIRICFIDYDREMALVAEHKDPKTEACSILGVGRLTKNRNLPEAEAAVLICDEYQGRGLGTELMRRLLDVARRENLQRVKADMLAENQSTQNICRKLGFTLQHEMGDPIVKAEIALEQSEGKI
jgi:acetyltransferase